MIKVLIVDDEPKLREGLRTFIDWGAFGYIVEDTAANGSEALEKFMLHRPGLVVADIRMPGMNGLQLIRKLREQDPVLHILILSGYAEFEYAKKAIAERADGYLLKPVDEDEFTGYLVKIKRDIEEERSSGHWKYMTAEWSREALIHSLLTGAEEPDSLCERAERLGVTGKCFQILLVCPYPEDDMEPVVTARLRGKLSEMFEQTGRGWVFNIYGRLGVLLKEPLLSVETNGVYREIRSELSGKGTEFTAAIGFKAEHLRDIGNSYNTACELIKEHFLLDRGQVLSPELLWTVKREPQSCPVDNQTPILGEQLYYAVDAGNLEAITRLVHRLGQCYIAEGCGEKEIKSRFVKVITAILGKAFRQYPELQSHGKPYADDLAEIYKVRTIQSLYEKSELILRQLVSRLGEGGKHRDVKIMLDLIHRNFRDNLKLDILSGIFNYNSAYLGKLFKHETGEYFNTYLDKLRIEKAKVYLEEGYKVYQVAEKVGYANVDYFHSKFRKYVGTSPSAYRKRSGNMPQF